MFFFSVIKSGYQSLWYLLVVWLVGMLHVTHTRNDEIVEYITAGYLVWLTHTRNDEIVEYITSGYLDLLHL